MTPEQFNDMIQTGVASGDWAGTEAPLRQTVLDMAENAMISGVVTNKMERAARNILNVNQAKRHVEGKPEWLDYNTAAGMLNVHPASISNYVRQARIPTRKINRRNYIHVGALPQLQAQQRRYRMTGPVANKGDVNSAILRVLERIARALEARLT